MAMQLPRDWRHRRERYQFIGGRCCECGAVHFPLRRVCPECGSADTEERRFCGRGEVYSYSVVYKAPAGFEGYVPYVVALIKLEEGPLVTAQLTEVEPEDVSVGMPVECVVRKWRERGTDGLITYGYKFRRRSLVEGT